MMKLPFVLLLMAGLVSGRDPEFGDDNLSDDWLPSPDGYRWPKPVKDAPEINPEPRKVSDLTDLEQEAIRRVWPVDDVPEEVRIASVDLNGDGRVELFVEIDPLRGSGGKFYEILHSSKGMAYQSIGGVQGGLQLVEKKGGWFQIEGTSRGGGGQYTRYLLAFKAEGYEIVRNEGHNYNTGEVKVRKGGVEAG